MNKTVETAGANRERQIPLIDVVVILAEYRWMIAKFVMGFLLAGGLYTFLSAEVFVAETKVVRESQTEMPSIGGFGGGLAALQGLGINVGSGQSGLTTRAFSSVLESREVRFAIAQDTFYFANKDRRLTLLEHIEEERKGGSFIFQVLDQLRLSVFGKSDPDSVRLGETNTFVSRSVVNDAVQRVGTMVTARVDQQSGLMTIEVRTGSARRSEEIAASAVTHLISRVREIRTRQTRENLAFITERFEEVKRELEEAEERLARFLQANQNPTTASLRFERDRLRRQVTFKEQLYTDLQGQLTQVRIELQRSQPVLTVVENPVAPMEPSSPNLPMNLVLSVILGLFLGVGSALVASFLSLERTEDTEYRNKVKTIREAFAPTSLFRILQKVVGRRRS